MKDLKKQVKWPTIFIGFSLSGLFLWLALRQVSKNNLISAFSNIDYQNVFVCCIALIVGIILRSARWRIISAYPFSQQLSFARATSLGVLTNLVIPARIGEIVRIITIIKIVGCSIARAFSSALIDRLVDMFVLLSVATALYLVFPIGEFINMWLLTFFLIAASILALIFFLRQKLRNHRQNNRLFSRKNAEPLGNRYQNLSHRTKT